MSGKKNSETIDMINGQLKIPMKSELEAPTYDEYYEPVVGVVTGCAKLNVRENPSMEASVVCVLRSEAEVEVDVTKDYGEWYHVCTATGLEGFCMKKFIDIRD